MTTSVKDMLAAANATVPRLQPAEVATMIGADGVYCASGGRPALAGKALQDLGYQSVFNAGSFKKLAEAGVGTEPA